MLLPPAVPSFLLSAALSCSSYRIAQISGTEQRTVIGKKEEEEAEEEQFPVDITLVLKVLRWFYNF